MREECLDRLVIITKLGTVAFIENEHHTLFAQRFQTLLVSLFPLPPLLPVAFAVFIQRKSQLLDSGDDDLIGIIIGEQTTHQRFSIGVFFDTAFLEAIEFLARLAIKIFTIDHEQALVDIRVVLEQGGCLEGSKRFTAAGGMPDVAVTAVLLNTLDNRLHCINLIGTHHQQFLLAGDQYHIAANHLAESTFGEEGIGKFIQVGNFLIVFTGPLIKRQEALVGVEAEVASVVVGKIPGFTAVTDNEQLQEAQQGFAVTVAGIVLVINNLLHGAARADGQCFQLDLHYGHTINEQHHVISMMAVIGVDTELIGHLEIVLAPVPGIDQGVMKWRTIIALEGISFPQIPGDSENVRRNDRFQQTLEFIVSKVHPVERLELLAEISFQRGVYLRSISRVTRCCSICFSVTVIIRI